MYTGIFMKSYGFSIIEVIVTVVIVGILATVAVVSLRGLSPDQTIANAAAEVRSALVLIRNYAHSGITCCGDVIPNGYGMLFTMDGTPDEAYQLYADLDASFNYSTNDPIIQSNVLPDGVSFIGCADSLISITTGDCDVFFAQTPPQDVYFSGLLGTSSIRFYIQHTNSGLTEDTILYYQTAVIE